MKTRRFLLLLLAWVSFDLATPLPGAFEFDPDDSEIEESVHVRRDAHGRRAAGPARVTPSERDGVAQPRPRPAPLLSDARRAAGDAWRPYVRLAHLPPSGRAETAEAH